MGGLFSILCSEVFFNDNVFFMDMFFNGYVFLWVCLFNGQVFLMGIYLFMGMFFLWGIIASNPGLFVRYL